MKPTTEAVSSKVGTEQRGKKKGDKGNGACASDTAKHTEGLGGELASTYLVLAVLADATATAVFASSLQRRQ